MVDYSATWLAIFTGATAKERIAARRIIDTEAIRRYNLDRENGSKLLYEFTVEHNPMLKGFNPMAEIDDNVPLPTNDGQGWAEVPANNGQPQAAQEAQPAAAPAPEAPKRRGRPPKAATAAQGDAPATTARKATAKAPSQAELLERALAFVSPFSDSELLDASDFVKLTGNMAICYNGQSAAGHPIEEMLNVAPQLEKLRAALKRSGKQLVLTETEGFGLVLQSGKFSAVVPCTNPAELVFIEPDAPAINGEFNGLKEAFKACGVLAHEKGQRVIEASILLQSNTASSTNGHMLLQYWHGYEMPAEFVLPKIFCQAVAACPLNITGLGGSWNAEQGIFSSFTIWFENGSWYKTQTYFDKWPALGHIIDIPSNPLPTPEGFFEGVAALADFIDDSSAVYLSNGMVSTARVGDELGASYQVPDLEASKTLNAELLKKAAPYATSIDFMTYPDKVMFFGEKARGALMAMSN